MNKDDADDLINNLISLFNGQIDSETFKQIFIPNYTDINRNGSFHFLTEYIFKEFCVRNMKLSKKEKIINLEKYKEIKDEYNNQIIFFIQILLEFNCDLFLVNTNNQSPLLLSINNNNYIMSKEFINILQNLGIYTTEDYLDFLDIIIKNGDCFNSDCLELINLILTNINENNNNSNEAFVSKLSTYLNSLCFNFSKNIYEKYNETIKIVGLNYIDKDIYGNIVVKQDDNVIQNIKNKSYEIIRDYFNKNFLSLFNKFIKSGAKIQYEKDSAFIHIMAFPFISDLPKFIQENKIDMNFKDKSGNTALSNLMNNKEHIIQISKDSFDNAFKYLIDNINIDITKDKEKSVFYLCLMEDYIEEAKIIYNKFKIFHDSYFNPIILNYIIENKNPEKIIEFLNKFKDVIDFNLFNSEHKRSLIHYICIYLSEDMDKFHKLFSFMDNLKIDYLLKDKYERNFLFYLFLDQNERKKKYDPIQQLMYVFEKYKFNNLNDKDIFGNNLLFYATRSRSSLCLDFLLSNGVILTNEQSKNENSVFSVCLIKNEIQLFYFLYDKLIDPSIFNHKVYETYQNKNTSNYSDLNLNKFQKGETLYDFLNKYNLDINNNINNKKSKNKKNVYGYNNNIIYNNANNNNINTNNNFNLNNNKNFNNLNNYNNISNLNNYNPPNNYLGNNQYLNQGLNNNINSNINDNMAQMNLNQTNFNIFSFIEENVKIFLNNLIDDIIIKINNNKIINDNNNDLQMNEIINSFNNNNDDYISDRIFSQRKIIAENLIIYSISKNYEDIIRFSFNEKFNPISICHGLILSNRNKDLKNYFLRILSQNNNDYDKLINLKDDKEQTIYHLLPYMEDNFYFCKKIENHNISNIYNKEGNTPMFNACKNFNTNFIEVFSHYSISSSENKSNDVNYDLFLETKNNKTPLEALYEQLNKKKNEILKLIIDISLNTKTVYFIPLIKYLIQNYRPSDNKLFQLDYQTNLNSEDYIKKLVGLYLFYIKEIKGNIMLKDEYGKDPFFLCVQYNNYDFLFNVLIEEDNIKLNSTNNEGKSIIHLLVSNALYENNNNILLKALKAGFDFSIKDNDGMTPLDYACFERNDEIVKIFIKYYTSSGIEIKENNSPKMTNKIDLNYNYNKDSDNFYNESISVSMSIDKSENLNGLVSPLFHYDPVISFYQVCVDDESSIPFSVNLVKKNFNNFNNQNHYYYIPNDEKKFCIQIIKDVNKDGEFLTLAIDNSQVQTFTFRDFKTAKQKFKDLFKELTANNWDYIKYNRLNFKTDYTKYYIFDSSYEQEDAIYDYLKITIKNLYIKQKIEYKNEKIKNLIYYLLVKSYQNKFSIDDNTLNVEENTKNIIQRYKSTAIIKAITILFELKKLINSKIIKDEIYFRKRNYLINSYNDLIPYSKKRNNLDDFNDNLNIDNEISRLTNYYYIENVLKIFLGAIYNLNNIHTLDYIITALGCKIEELPKPKSKKKDLNTEADYIYNYIYSTNGRFSQITAIYKITESVNDKNFNLNNFKNRYLFFHGTKVENVIGILSQGLKIAPVQAINTGKSYGSGIYLSDSFSCSLGYCSHFSRLNRMNNFNYNLNEKKFMFMAEVAVGKVGYNDDTYLVGTTVDFNDYFVTDEGFRIFKNTNNINYGYGVIVAQEETNVRIKYLIEIN